MEIILWIIALIIILAFLVAGFVGYINLCEKSPCEMIRKTGECPFKDYGCCKDCPYLDNNKKKVEEDE